MNVARMPAGDIAPRSRFYFPFPFGSLTGTCGDELTILGLPSEWVWPRMIDSKSRKNFSASMMRPRCSFFGFVVAKSMQFNHFRESAG